MNRIETRRDIGLIAVCGTATQRRTPPPELKVVQVSAEELAGRLHPDLPRRMTIGTLDLWSGMNSANVTTREHVTPFAKMVFNELRAQYRALVLVFGTNTGADFATALALAEGRGLDIPIIVVSGQRHNDREGADSPKNIEFGVMAAKAASEQRVAEVMVFSGEAGQEVLRAVTTEKASDNNKIIYRSPNTASLAVITGHDINFRRHAHRINPDIVPVLYPEFTGKVVIFRLHTDFEPEFLTMVTKKNLRAKKGADVIIIDGYETGNLPDRFLSVVEQIVAGSTQVIVVPHFNEPNLTRRIPREEQNAVLAGAITAPGNVTKPALVAKIRQLRAHPELVTARGGFEEALNTNFVGEIPEEE